MRVQFGSLSNGVKFYQIEPDGTVFREAVLMKFETIRFAGASFEHLRIERQYRRVEKAQAINAIVTDAENPFALACFDYFSDDMEVYKIQPN